MRRYGSSGDGEADLEPDVAADEHPGCLFVVADASQVAAARVCGAACQAGSPYCPRHHRRCHLRGGSTAEQRRLREIEGLAAAVGGKQTAARDTPTSGALRRIERSGQAFARSFCSRIVQEVNDAARPPRD